VKNKTTETIFEVSGLHSAPPHAVIDVMEHIRGHGSLALHTEVPTPHLEAFKATGWDYYHPTLASGKKSEMVLTWDTATWEVLDDLLLPLTNISWTVGKIHRDGVTGVGLKVQHKETGAIGKIVGLHWPSGIFKFAVRGRAHRQTTAALGQHTRAWQQNHPDHFVIAAGDTNVDHSRPAIRQDFEKTLGLEDLWSNSHANIGTHGPKRDIDSIFGSNGLHMHSGRVYPQTKASDHKPISCDVVLEHYAK
jgi:hypothetical protein